MKIKMYLAALLASFQLIMTAQTIGWEWAGGSKGINREGGMEIAVDSKGNSYSIGSSNSPDVNFGTLNSINTGNIYLVKYDPVGKPVWIRRVGNAISGLPTDVAVDANDNIYMTGIFNGVLYFGTDTLWATRTSVFLAKYTSDGAVVWGQQISHVSQVGGGKLGIDQTGNTYTGTTVVVNGAKKVILEKRNSTGSLLWTAESEGTAFDIRVSGIVAKDENVYVAGTFVSGSMIWGTDTLKNDSSTTVGFFVKLNSSGVQWSKKIVATTQATLSDLAIDKDETIYMAGNFEGDQIVFDSLIINNTGSSSKKDEFLVKYNSSGGILSGKKLGIKGGDIAGLGVDKDRNIFLAVNYEAGLYINTAVFKCDASGNKLDSVYTRTPFGSYVGDIAVDNDGNAYVTGDYTDVMYFGDIQIAGTGFGKHFYESFIAKVSNCFSLAPSSSLCYVSVDQVSKHNIIKWNPATLPSNVEGIAIYRETEPGVFKWVGEKAAADSVFSDADTTFYPPYTGDPNKGYYRYKIKTRNKCGLYSEFSVVSGYTLFIRQDNGTFTYDLTYGGDISYALMRDDFGKGKWQVVTKDLDPGTYYSFTDPDYADFKTTARWRVQSIQSVGCTWRVPLYSNILPLRDTLTSVNDMQLANQIKMVPNPAKGQFEISSTKQEIKGIEIYTIYGSLVYRSANTINNTIITDISSLSNGIYTVKTITQKGTSIKKLIVQQ